MQCHRRVDVRMKRIWVPTGLSSQATSAETMQLLGNLMLVIVMVVEWVIWMIWITSKEVCESTLFQQTLIGLGF